jgi:hypothetical protein
VLIAEPEAELRAILMAEIEEHAGVPVGEYVAGYSEAAEGDGAVVASLPGHSQLSHAMTLRLRSVGGSLEGQARPAADSVVTIVSRSATIRRAARAMLIAVGLAADALSEVDPAVDGWRERLGLSALVICDGIAARELPAGLSGAGVPDDCGFFDRGIEGAV